MDQIIAEFATQFGGLGEEARVFVRAGVLGLFFTMIVGEILAARRRSRQIHDAKETFANLGILAGTQISKALLFGWQILVLSTVAQFGLPAWPIGSSGSYAIALSFAATLLAVDFCYYWQHRINHETKLFWAFHLVHHSGQQMNLTTSFRLNWVTPLVSPLFYTPAALLGAPVLFIAAGLALNLLYQFWLHTTLVPRLGFLEGIINTPSAHRVHHGSNEEYLDKNYGGILMIWDRIFGTYARERDDVPLRFGVTTGHAGYNPIRLVFYGFLDLFRGRLHSKG